MQSKFQKMETKLYKRLPYGNSDFKSIITENYAYVDKTRYIEMLENEFNPNQFFTRPHRRIDKGEDGVMALQEIFMLPN